MPYFSQYLCPPLADLRTAFGLLDRDSDGHVTPAELQFMLRNLGIEVKDDLIAELVKDASKTGMWFFGLRFWSPSVGSG